MSEQLELIADAQTSRDHVHPEHPIYGVSLNKTGITPVGYKLLVEIPPAVVKRGALFIPETTADREKTASVVAKVIQIGADAYRDKDRYPRGPWCKPGDYVAMSPYNGTRIKSPITEADLRFINEDSIDGVVPSPDVVERG